MGLGLVPSNSLQPWVAVNDALQLLDALAQLTVESRTLTTPPATTSGDVGKRWIVAASATGDWAGHDGDIALCTAAGLWRYLEPKDGWEATVLDEGVATQVYRYSGGAWASVRIDTLARPLNPSLASGGGTATIDLSLGKEVYHITLTENTTIVFTNPPAGNYVAEVRVRVKQHASAAKTCTFSGTSVKYAGGGAWSVSAVLSSVEDVGVTIDSAGNLTLYPSGVLA